MQTQLADLEEKQQILIGCINEWHEVQLAYIPGIGPLVANTALKLLSLTAEDEILQDFQKYWLVKHCTGR